MSTDQWARLGMGIAGSLVLALIVAAFVDSGRDVTQPPLSIWKLVGSFIGVFGGGTALAIAVVLL
ncbi:hypothetical protein [Mycobacterium sp. 852002-51152_SCH6134967]|uniref:hypothetical protein n=1 Tax=Mycobacterium sp. 852002-51152_SCH6134967 TaxID=1834096 RepID=UPI000A70AE41|nr:hypothetical protein [Mycobacterium sp. 852002-51152_SCH6134967]